ncbi:MAG TPA: DeoR family transcriptional regulator [Candidatus Paceibacterota bacterium]|nr:DeoR family transcriptional regulator [Candidatus Paceibacterota bacterium]
MEPKKDKDMDLIIRDNVFYGNNLLYFIYKKCLKVSKAVYLITDIMKDVEPIKWSLRKAAANLAVIKDDEDARKAASTIGVKIGNTRTLILLANFSKNISNMNAEVLVKECDEIQRILGEMENFSGNFLSLSEDFFDTPNVQAATAPSPFLQAIENDKEKSLESYKGHIKDKENIVSFKPKLAPFIKPDIRSSQPPREEFKTNRSERILMIIKDKGEVSIKDISILFSECSEKTIQRELNDLLNHGKIKKTGDRRWSRYSLK